MFEIIMLLGFFLAATSRMLPEKSQEADDESETGDFLSIARRTQKAHVFQDRDRGKRCKGRLGVV